MIANRRHTPVFATALLLAGMASAMPGNAQTLVYRSVDEQGRVSFGDRPLADAVVVEEIHLATPAARGVEAASEAHIEQLAATTRRLREDRLAREEQRAKEESARQPPREYPEAPAYPSASRYWGVSQVYPNRGFLHYPRSPFHLDPAAGRNWQGGNRPPPLGHHRSPRGNRAGWEEPPRRLLRNASQ